MEKNNFSQSRLLSLDFFRGLTMFLLIAEFTHLFDYLIAPEFKNTIIYFIGQQLHHHPWNGFRFWDLIQPFFMYIVGVAMPLSYYKRISKGESHNQIRKHIIIRSVLLLFLGWWLYCMIFGEITFYFQNVLAQLSVTIIISFLIMRKSYITQIAISIGLLLFIELVYRTFWVEGFNHPFTPDQNFGTWFDTLIAGKVFGGHWVSINAIPTTAHTIWGVLTGKLLLSDKSNIKKLQIMLIAAITLLIIGYGLSPITPIIKRIATSTFVLYSAGWTILVFAISFWIIDILNLKKGVLFFAIVGMNPLFIYLFAHVGGAKITNSIIQPLTSTLLSWTNDLTINISTTLISTFLLWYICYWMYKRKIFIKI